MMSAKKSAAFVLTRTIASTVRLMSLAVGLLGWPRALLAQPADDQQIPSSVYGLDDNQGNDSASPADSSSEGATTPGAASHTVLKGDTLWDISRTHFRDPWRWPKVWALNPEIANPHWIFPGQAIRLRDPDAAAPNATGGVAAPVGIGTAGGGALPAQAAEPGAGTRQLRQIGFVDEDGLKAAGVINGSLEEKILLATGDHAYVEFPPDHPPKGGARYTVYAIATDHPIRDPGSERVLGYLVHVYGEVVIDGLTDRPVANARLVDLVEPVERGYRVGPIVRQLKAVTPRHNAADTTAHIVDAVEPNLLIANEMFVVLDRGQRHGVQVGNRFLVVRQGDGIKRVMESWDATDHRFPPHAVAEIFAVEVQRETTIGWISRGTRELHRGDVADLRRGY